MRPHAWLVVCLLVLVTPNRLTAQTSLDLYRQSVQLMADAALARAEGRFTVALNLSERALDAQQRSGQASGLWTHWQAIGDNLFSLTRLEDAMRAYTRVERLHPTADGKARAVRDRVKVALAGNDRRTAITLASGLRRQANASIGDPGARLAMIDADLANHAREPREALTLLRRALDRADVNNVTLRLEISAMALTVLLDAVSRQPAEDLATLVDEVERLFPDLPIPVRPFVRQAGRIRLRQLGAYDQLLRDDTRQLQRARTGGTVGAQIEALSQLAATHRATYNHDDERVALEELLTLVPAAQHEPYETRLAHVLLTLDDITAAAPAIETLARGPAPSIDAQLVIARLRVRQRRVEDAERILAGLVHNITGATHPFDQVQILMEWARFGADHGAPQQDVEERYDRAQQTAASLGRWEDLQVIRLERAGYSVGCVDGASATCIATTLRALDAIDPAAVGDARWRVPYLRGRVSELAHQPDAALASYRAAMAALDAQRRGVGDQAQRQSLGAQPAAIELAERLTQVLLAQGLVGEAWRVVEDTRARAFRESLEATRAGITTLPTPELRSLEARLVELRTQLAPEHRGVLRSAGRDPAVLEHSLAQTERQFRQARTQASLEQSPSMRRSGHTTLAMDTVMRTLAPHAALVSYAAVPSGHVAFVLTNNSHRVVTLPHRRAELDDDLATARRLLQQPDDLASLDVVLARVAARVVLPVLSSLPASVSQLTIVPTGALHYVPFEVYPTDGSARLTDRFTIRYAAAGSLTGHNGPVRTSSTVFLGALGDVRVEGWSPLPGTLAEVDHIRQFLPEATTATRDGFTHEAVVTALRTHDVVHLATHGVLNEWAPPFTSLLVAPTTSEPRTRLPLYEIARMHLAARTVILSACETGIGRLMRGDEMTSLSRAFFLAGAETVVASLWEVADDTTATLMEQLHRGLREGLTPAEALQRASHRVRANHPHPFYWAPFIVTGG